MVSSDQGSHHLHFQAILPPPARVEDSHWHWSRAFVHIFLALSALGLNLGLPGRGWHKAWWMQPGNREWLWKQCESGTSLPATPRLELGWVITEEAGVWGQGAAERDSLSPGPLSPGGLTILTTTTQIWQLQWAQGSFH